MITNVILIVTFLGYFDTVSSSTPKIWLSEYGYKHEDWEADTLQVVTFPAEPEFRTENNFQNDFLAKTGTQYVAWGNTTDVVFTCQADQPIFWSFAQGLNKLTMIPSWNILIVNLRSSHSSFETDSFKSLIAIDISRDSYVYYDHSELSLLDKVPSHPSWIFTCATTNNNHENISGLSSSITLRTYDYDLEYETQGRKTGNLKPDEKIMTAVLKTSTSPAAVNKMTATTLLRFDDSILYVPNGYANKNHIILQSNLTAKFGEIYEEDEDGRGHFNFAGNGTVTKLMEYGKDEGIYEGDSIQIFCYSLHTFYVFGAYLQINWENGTTSILEEVDTEMKGIQVSLNSNGIENHPLFAKNADGEGGIQNLIHVDLLFYLSQPFEAKREMKSVDCFMPVWSSGADWDKVTRQLNVLSKTQ